MESGPCPFRLSSTWSLLYHIHLRRGIHPLPFSYSLSLSFPLFSLSSCRVNTSHLVPIFCNSPPAYRVDGCEPPRVGTCLHRPARKSQAGRVNFRELPLQINTTALFSSLHLTAAFLFPPLPSVRSLLHFSPAPSRPTLSIHPPACSPKAQMSLHPSCTVQYDCSQSNELLNLGKLTSLEMFLMFKLNETLPKKKKKYRCLSEWERVLGVVKTECRGHKDLVFTVGFHH